MNTALQKIAAAVGFLLFIAALAIGLLRDVPLLMALYRAVMVMLLSTVAVGLFFYFFARVLFNFIHEQQLQAEEAAQQEAQKKKDNGRNNGQEK